MCFIYLELEISFFVCVHGQERIFHESLYFMKLEDLHLRFITYFRYEELWDYSWKIDQYVQESLSCIKIHKKHDKDFASVLSKPFNILSEYLYMKKNFEDHQKARQQQLEDTINFLNEIENVEDLRLYYDFLRLR